MRYLYYTNYLSGHSGLSNGIMSVEIGVVLAHLTNRLLVLDGNVSPPANIVAYDGRVNNGNPSRVTDLIDIPLPWAEPDSVHLEGLESLELTNLSLGSIAFYFPNTVNVSSKDARSFARDRDHWLTLSGEHERVPVLRLSEDPLIPGTDRHRTNLSYYSYLFYLNDETRRSVYRVLQRMQPKPAFSDLAKRVARDIGPFNAVHMRRGDFKVTYGVTTLDRQPWEAIEAMDQVFSREDPLLIVTDERDDPFFDEIKLAYPDHFFVDWHILDHYGAEFSRLPRTDSLSLAYLSQLVAAEAQEFIGTMTSTFTALIQRYRGNGGKQEAFRYLWNELPAPGGAFERGRHAVSDCIPLDRGVMVEEFEGTYTWNRVSQLLNPAWMREWPESFLTPEVLATGELASRQRNDPDMVSPPVVDNAELPAIQVAFGNLQVTVRCSDAQLLHQLAPGLGAMPGTPPRNVIAALAIRNTGNRYRVQPAEGSPGESCSKAGLADTLRQVIVGIFSRVRKGHSWLAGTALARDGNGLLVTGDTGAADDSLVGAMRKKGWDLLDSGIVAVRNSDLMIIPLGARTQPEGTAAHTGRLLTPLAGVVLADRMPLYGNDVMVPISPATTAAQLIPASHDFRSERRGAVERLCRLAGERPAARLGWDNPQQAATLISQWADANTPAGA